MFVCLVLCFFLVVFLNSHSQGDMFVPLVLWCFCCCFCNSWSQEYVCLLGSVVFGAALFVTLRAKEYVCFTYMPAAAAQRQRGWNCSPCIHSTGLWWPPAERTMPVPDPHTSWPASTATMLQQHIMPEISTVIVMLKHVTLCLLVQSPASV